MVSKMNNQFVPNYAVSPGDVLAEEMDARDMTQSDLADRTGLARKTINEIVNAKGPISPETALMFERVFEQPARYWLELERNYQETVARLSEQARMLKDVDWLKNLPVRKMIKFNWIKSRPSKTETLDSILKFFGISNIKQWDIVWSGLNVAYRKSINKPASPFAVSAWIRQGQIEAQRLAETSFNKEAFKSCLVEVRSLTREPDPKLFVPKVQELCSSCGVAVVFLPELPGSRVCGATYWIKNTAVIQLSARYKSDDQLWFTFFHEAGHINLHGKTQLFLEGSTKQSAKEVEADEFAARTLVSRSALVELLAHSRLSDTLIIQLAERLGIAPGIVVGQLQHGRHIPYSHFNTLKQFYRWS